MRKIKVGWSNGAPLAEDLWRLRWWIALVFVAAWILGWGILAGWWS